jgi:hypothetical protein
MIKFIILAILSVFVISCTPVKGESTHKLNKTLSFKGQKFGKEITLKEITKISDILKTPKNFVNKKVLVKGTVTSVCSRRGCWMDIVGAAPGERIRIKVQDGKIVFPVTVKGKDAVVEGVIYAIQIKDKQGKSECGRVHKKNDAHTECQQKVAPDVKTIYQIKGSSAVILD